MLKKGGVFALNDEMKPHMYGTWSLRPGTAGHGICGCTAHRHGPQEAFGSRRRAAMMMLGDSRMLVGRK